MKLLSVNKKKKEVISKSVEVLKEGGLVIYPTETCYGVGVDATNQSAVRKLLEYKRRPEGKAISIAVSNRKMADKYVEINEIAENLYKNFLPGPLTVISKSRHKTAKGLEAEDGTLGVRIPDHPLAIKIIKSLGKPITATSANSSGKKTPYSVKDILDNISNKQKELIDLILDAGKLPKNPPSTVVDTTVHSPEIIRKGSIDLSKVKSYVSNSEEETIKIAEKFVGNLLSKLNYKCLIFALQGELGVGKTRFAKGIARGLGIKENIVSPTYMLVREYSFKLKAQKSKQGYINTHHLSSITHNLYHIDTWRMRGADELLDLGFYNMLKRGNIIVIEWIQKVRGILEDIKGRKDIKIIWVDMKYESKEERRTILING